MWLGFMCQNITKNVVSCLCNLSSLHQIHQATLKQYQTTPSWDGRTPRFGSKAVIRWLARKQITQKSSNFVKDELSTDEFMLLNFLETPECRRPSWKTWWLRRSSATYTKLQVSELLFSWRSWIARPLSVWTLFITTEYIPLKWINTSYPSLCGLLEYSRLKIPLTACLPNSKLAVKIFEV